MGTWPVFKAASFCSSLSTRMTSCPRSAKHAPATSPTYPDPTTAICIRCSGYLSENRFDNYFISFPAELPPITDAGDRMVMDHTGRPISAQRSLPPAVQVAGKPAIRAAILQIGADHL